MGYQRQLLIRRAIGILIGIFLCFGMPALLGLLNSAQIVIPFLVLVGIGALAFWLDHKYWGHLTSFVKLRTALAVGLAVTSAVLVAILLDPRPKNFAWYYSFIIAPLVGSSVGVVAAVLAPLNWKVREFIWGKKPIRLYGRINKSDDEPDQK